MMPDPKPERPDLDDYLKCDDIVDFDDPSIEEASEQLTEGLKGNTAKAKAIFEFVRDQIFHSLDINATSITLKASEVLEKGHGLCYAQAHLLAALMRAADIPAGFCYQIQKGDSDDDRVVVHGFNAVYLEDLEKWVRLDASRFNEENHAWYDEDDDLPELLISSDEVLFDDPVIYINPSKHVVKTLKRYEAIEELRDHLPDKI